MKLLAIDETGKLIQFKEQKFQLANKEIDLEVLLVNNPEYFFDDSKILIIGQQLIPNLNTY